MASGGKRKGAGRPKAAPTKNITFRVPIIWIDEIKNMVKERMTELRNNVNYKLSEFYGLEKLNLITMDIKSRIEEIISNNIEIGETENRLDYIVHNTSELAEKIVKLCNLQNVTTRFSPTEIENVMRKVKKAKMSPYLKQILQRATGESYNSADDKAFLDKYTGKVVNVYEWAGDWWIAEDDNYVITEDCFTTL